MMNDRGWAKVFFIMSIPIILNGLFLLADFVDWVDEINIGVLIISFLVFIAARIWEMKGRDVVAIMIANIGVLILNFLSLFKVL